VNLILAVLVILLLILLFKMMRRPSGMAIGVVVPDNGPALKYAGFWRRLGALLIDFLLIVPMTVLYVWATSFSRTHALAGYLVVAILSCGYYVYCHARFGQTLGKWITGVRVTKLDGSAIGWRQALLRSSVDMIFGALGIVAFVMALKTIPDDQFYGLTWQARLKNIGAFKPAAFSWSDGAEAIWSWSEVVVMLFNAKRRALHDFIAGTVVIIKKP